MSDYDVVIIGAGPAGLSAAIYTTRYGLSTAIIEKGLIGGTATLASSVQNYAGFSEISGMELMMKFQEQAEKSGAKIILDTVEKVTDKGKEMHIKTSEGSITARAVIVAVGAKSKWLKVKGEKEFLNKGVHFCATCDGAMYASKEVIVIGNDNRALDEAIYLTKITKKVTLISPKKELTADEAKITTLKQTKAEIILGANITGFEGKETLEAAKVKIGNGKETEIKCSAAFISIGSDPNTEFVDVKKDKEGRIIVNHSMETNVEGILAAGDCIQKKLYQIATSVGEGATAAFTAHEYISRTNSQ